MTGKKYDEMKFQWVSHPENFLLRATSDGFTIHSSLVFVFELRGIRVRESVPPNTKVSLHRSTLPRLKAQMVRDHLLRSHHPNHYAHTAYIAAVAASGGKPTFLDKLREWWYDTFAT